jgi:glycine betaine catabolism B
MSFKISKQNDQLENKIVFDYTAGQFAFFDIGEVYNDPKGPIRHFTISSSPKYSNCWNRNSGTICSYRSYI